MFFVFPIRTSIRPSRTPYTNYALIIANIIIFILSMVYKTDPTTGGSVLDLRNWAEQFMLVPVRPGIWQFVSYAFLHSGFMHIGGNMFFLHLFGRNVNDKLGNVGYLSFYLAGAVFSGIGHTLLSNSPVLGASGAVAAVTGAYLVLFPHTLITVFYWMLIFLDTIEISALYFIGIKMILFDNYIAASSPNVAYDAHLAGYAFGIGAILLMLKLGILSKSQYDLYAMIRQWNRRRQFKDVVSKGYDPYTGSGSKKIRIREVKKSSFSDEQTKRIQELRDEIAGRINERNHSAAAQKYLELIEIDKEQVPPRQFLLDIANQLASENKHTEAAQAYEKFIGHYSKYEYIEQVQLMLGIVYSRYLNKPKLAIENLDAALDRLSDIGQVKMCRDELDKLKG